MRTFPNQIGVNLALSHSVAIARSAPMLKALSRSVGCTDPPRKGSTEYQKRMALFNERLKKAELLNSQPGRAWTAGTSPLADYTEEEWNWGFHEWSQELDGKWEAHIAS